MGEATPGGTQGAALAARVADELPELRESVSRFDPNHVAWFLGRKEIAHLHSPTSLDARIPRAAQRAWEEDPRLVPRKSASPWMEIRIEGAADVDDAFELVRQAFEAERGG